MIKRAETSVVERTKLRHALEVATEELEVAERQRDDEKRKESDDLAEEVEDVGKERVYGGERA